MNQYFTADVCNHPINCHALLGSILEVRRGRSGPQIRRLDYEPRRLDRSQYWHPNIQSSARRRSNPTSLRCHPAAMYGVKYSVEQCRWMCEHIISETVRELWRSMGRQYRLPHHSSRARPSAATSKFALTSITCLTTRRLNCPQTGPLPPCGSYWRWQMCGLCISSWILQRSGPLQRPARRDVHVPLIAGWSPSMCIQGLEAFRSRFTYVQ